MSEVSFLKKKNVYTNSKFTQLTLNTSNTDDLNYCLSQKIILDNVGLVLFYVLFSFCYVKLKILVLVP